MSEEGSTQGDVTAMGMYAVGIRPLMDKLGEVVDSQKCRQVWYADDSGSAGKLLEMKKWWDKLFIEGPKYGYHPKPSKTVLIVKNLELKEQAKAIFGQTGISIDTSGERHLGAVIGTESFKELYVKKKIDQWVEDVNQLSLIAQDEPQIALSAYTKALCMRWCFVQRTISGIGHLFEPLEDAIRNNFIPAVVGRNVSEIERRMLALPVRFGGIGIQNPVETADSEYEASTVVTENLKCIIVNQENNFENLDEGGIHEAINKTKREKERRFTQEFEYIKSQVNADLKRCLLGFFRSFQPS